MPKRWFQDSYDLHQFYNEMKSKYPSLHLNKVIKNGEMYVEWEIKGLD